MKFVAGLFIVFGAVTGLLLIGENATIAQQRRCDDPGMSMVEMRNCEDARRQRELKNSRGKACSDKTCIYRLTLKKRETKIQDGVRITVQVFAGYGFEFHVGEFIEVGDGEFGAWLFDSEGKLTTVKQCSGTACGGLYEYHSGPLNGAYLLAVSGSWVLHLPR